MAKTVMKDNFSEHYPDKDILPAVKKGTSLTGDNFWKGMYGHVTAKYIADYYKTPDPYAITTITRSKKKTRKLWTSSNLRCTISSTPAV